MPNATVQQWKQNGSGKLTPTLGLPINVSAITVGADGITFHDGSVLTSTGAAASKNLGNSVVDDGAGNLSVRTDTSLRYIVLSSSLGVQLADGTLQVGEDGLSVAIVPAEQISGLATVATSGSYGDLGDTPDLSLLGTFNGADQLVKLSDSGTINDTPGNMPSVDFNGRILDDLQGNRSVDWANYLLACTGATSVDWQDHWLVYENQATVDWGQCLLNTIAGMGSIDWQNQWLLNNNGTVGVDFGLNYLVRPGGGNAVDWQNSQLITNDNEALNWASYLLRDSNAIPSVDWSNRQLFGNGDVTVDWLNYTLNMLGGAPSLDWNNQVLRSNYYGTQRRLNWFYGIAYDDAGNESMSWAGHYLTGSTGGTLNWDDGISIYAAADIVQLKVQANEYGQTSDIMQWLAGNGSDWYMKVDGNGALRINQALSAGIMFVDTTYGYDLVGTIAPSNPNLNVSAIGDLVLTAGLTGYMPNVATLSQGGSFRTLNNTLDDGYGSASFLHLTTSDGYWRIDLNNCQLLNGDGTYLALDWSSVSVRMPNLPTTPDGLPSGSLWNNAGVVNIV